jgi:hypothetical protein
MNSLHDPQGLSVSIHLNTMEAEGLAHLCRILEWEFLAGHSQLAQHAMEARYALAKLRFALSDAGFSAMPEKAIDFDSLSSLGSTEIAASTAT